VLLAVQKHLSTSLREIADKREVIGNSIRDVTVGVVSVAVATCALIVTTQLVETVLLRLVALPWKRTTRRHDDDDDDDVTGQHQWQRRRRGECISKDWRSTSNATQFDDVTETCCPHQRNVIMFDLSSGFAETNV